MKYQLNTNFTKLSEKSGVIENQSTYATVEFVTASVTPTPGTGIYIAPGDKYRFSLTSSDAYVRFTAVRQGDYQREIAVVEDKICTGNNSEAATCTAIEDWDTNIDYKKDEFIIYNNNLYRANADHSSGSFIADLAADKWQLIGDLQAMLYTALQTTNKTLIGAINELQSDKLALAGGTMSGDIVQPNIPTLSEHLANKAYVDKVIADLVGGAPGDLDTLNKLAAALAADANLSATLLNMIGQKLDAVEVTTTATANKVLRLDGNSTLQANAATASKLKNPILINGQPWQGDTDINISAAAKIEDWQNTKSYTKGDLVIYNHLLFQAIRSHVSSVNFGDDMLTGHEKWKIIGGAGAAVSIKYSQATKLGVTATTDNPEIIDLPITQTATFCLPPPEILKNNLVTESGVVKNEAANFKANNNYVVGDVIKLKTDYVIAMPTTAFADQYISESNEIDFKIIEKIEVV